LKEMLCARLGQTSVADCGEKMFGLEVDEEDNEFNVYGDIQMHSLGGYWHGRTYFTEILTRDVPRLPYARISNITLTALEVTGWYKVNWDSGLIEPLEWGNYRSIIGMPKQDFSNFLWGKPGSPGVWPAHYVDRTAQEVEETFRCTFDHRAAGTSVRSADQSDAQLPRGVRRCDATPATDGCGDPPWQFYDSENIGFYGEKNVDYALIRYPDSRLYCQGRWPAGLPRDYEHFGTKFGNTSFCAMATLFDGTSAYKSYMPICYEMGCDWYARLVIFVGQESRRCDSAGQKITFTDYHGNIICPEPKVVFGMLQ
jgi:hypothetical protein